MTEKFNKEFKDWLFDNLHILSYRMPVEIQDQVAAKKLDFGFIQSDKNIFDKDFIESRSPYTFHFLMI